ncbi:MAG: tRNA epoxyqueuosine(34) reductase QueG [Phycisphaerales bacterium]|nr:tRNA epoxyqueuosine(34) reductase QueG [Phycisphaerales bacterium]
MSESTAIRTLDNLCRQMGFARWGICPAQPTLHKDELFAYIRAGMHASMNWLADTVDLRADPQQMMPGVRSLILVSDLYQPRDGGGQAEPHTPGVGKIARYAHGADYHTLLKTRLHRVCDALRDILPGEQFRAFVDTAPVLEREHAARAGLGWIGKNTLLIDPVLGSYLLLGGIMTTADLPVPATQQPIPDHCGSCTRCIDACPTHAITPYRVDARLCISRLTIEHRGEIDPKQHRAIGDWLFGCDICQEVCPHNSAQSDRDASLSCDAYAPRRRGLDLHRVLQWKEEDRHDILRGTAVKRATLDMLKRNAAICLANEQHSGSWQDQ